MFGGTVDRLEGDFTAINRIIDQFLSYAQGQSGLGGGASKLLADMLADIVAQYRHHGDDVELLRFEGNAISPPEVTVHRLMMNLIDNALTHGFGSVDVEVLAEDKELWLVVFDRGEGMTAQELERATLPFVRLSDTSSRTGHCGLGLAIVAQIANQLGGRVIGIPHDGARSGVGVAVPLDKIWGSQNEPSRGDGSRDGAIDAI